MADLVSTTVAALSTADGTNRLSGFVYSDSNGDGSRGQEVGVPGVQMALAGTDTSGQAIASTRLTADDGSFSYTPTGNFNGTDTFTYQAGVGQLTSGTVEMPGRFRSLLA